MSYPKIVFVDGPSGVGKGYFIENFTKLYKEKCPKAVIHSVRLADLVLTGDAKTEERKSTAYSTPIDKVETIFQGHLESLHKLAAICKGFNSAVDIVIVDRSFLSFYIYNWKVLVASLTDGGSAITVNRLNECSVVKYQTAYKETLKDFSALYVGLNVTEPDDDRNVKILADRLSSRNNGNAIQKDWLLYLVRSYRSAPSELYDVYSSLSFCKSDDYTKVLKLHF